MRRAPKEGYDFARKRDYRRKVWATFRDELKRRRLSVKESHALLMPSLEGKEIEVALAAGFREQNLHVVDSEPAIVATLKRRYPRINTYGVTASRAVQRIGDDGIALRCANLDFCGQISNSYRMELGKTIMAGALGWRVTDYGKKHSRITCTKTPGFDSECIVAVSVLRGREPKSITTQWDNDDIGDEALGRIHESILQRCLDRVNAAPEWFKTRAVNMVAQAGIKSIKQIEMLEQLSEYDRQRIAAIQILLGLDVSVVDKRIRPHPELIRVESYLSSSGQTMLWGIWEVTQIQRMANQAWAADQKRISMGLQPSKEFYPGLQQYLEETGAWEHCKGPASGG